MVYVLVKKNVQLKIVNIVLLMLIIKNNVLYVMKNMHY